jgi:hypothetical protein
MSIHRVAVEEQATGNLVPAELDDALPVDALFDIEDGWERSRKAMKQALRRAKVSRRRWPQSLHWNWAGKSVLIALRHRPQDYRVFGLRVGQEWQGAMLTLKNENVAKLDSASGQPLIYVDFLESAPWNWTVPGINQVRRYGKVGPVLLRFAVEHSVAEGCGGRLGLHALDQAESFYTAIGMTPLGPDEDKDDLAYFEFTEQAASLFLRR